MTVPFGALVGVGARFSNIIPGTSRFRDWIWPDPTQLNQNPSSELGARLGTLTHGSGASPATALTTDYNGGGSNNIGFWNGIMCSAVTSGPAAGQGRSLRFDGMAGFVKTSKNLIGPFQDDLHCWRFLWNMAITAATPDTSRDCGGWLVIPNVNPRPIADNAKGFGFRYKDANTVVFFANGNNGYTETPLTAAPFDVTAWHSYELAIQGATSAQDASLVAYIDGAAKPLPTLFGSWATGSNLPFSGILGGRGGFAPAVCNVANSSLTLVVQQVRSMCGPFISSLY